MLFLWDNQIKISLVNIDFFHRYCAVTNGKIENIYMFEEAVSENDPSCFYSYY